MLKCDQKIVVIDTETNWNDRVMSIGAVLSNDTYDPIDYCYLILDPEYEVGGIFSDELFIDNVKYDVLSRKNAVNVLKKWLNDNKVNSIFAYNATFDFHHLYELHCFKWYDIMKVAAYKQYNKSICSEECYKTGRLVRNYGVESILKRLLGNSYFEKHNALFDAIDELKIMKLLGHDLDVYSIAKI